MYRLTIGSTSMVSSAMVTERETHYLLFSPARVTPFFHLFSCFHVIETFDGLICALGSRARPLLYTYALILRFRQNRVYRST